MPPVGVTSKQPGNGGADLALAPGTQEADSAPAFRPVPPAGRHHFLHGRKVLVVDDDPRNAFVLTDVLQLHGMTVVEAADGRRAIAELTAGGFDIVLMDVMMPEMDGHETTRTIRQMSQHANLPVIAVTARAMQGDREKSPRRRRHRLHHQADRRRGTAQLHGTMAGADARVPALTVPLRVVKTNCGHADSVRHRT